MQGDISSLCIGVHCDISALCIRMNCDISALYVSGECLVVHAALQQEKTDSVVSTHYTLHTTHYTLHTTHYTLHTTHYSLLTTHYTLHTTHYSPHTTHHSPLTTHHSPLTTHHSPLNTQYTHYTLTSPLFLPLCVFHNLGSSVVTTTLMTLPDTAPNACQLYVPNASHFSRP